MAPFRRLAAELLLGAALAPAGCVPAPDPASVPPAAGAAVPNYVQSVRASEVDLWRGMNDRGLTLDVRGPEEWNDALGHLDGAMQIPFAELEGRLGEIAAYRDRPVLVYEHLTGADGIRVTIRWRGTEHSARQYLARIRLSAITWRQRTADLVAATPRDPPAIEPGALDHDRLAEQRAMKLAAWRRRYPTGWRCAAVGVGVLIEENPPQAEAIRRAVKTVLEQPDYRACAQEFQREIRKLPSLVEAVKRLEILAETRVPQRTHHQSDVCSLV